MGVNSSSPLFRALVVFIISFCSLCSFLYFSPYQEKAFFKERLDNQTNYIHRSIVREINAKIHALQRMVSRAESRQSVTKEYWEFDASLYFKLPGGYRSIEFFDRHHKPQWLVSSINNSISIVNYVPGSGVNEFFELAREQKDMLNSGVIELHDGTHIFILFFPIYFSEKFIGTILAAVDVHSVLNSIYFDEVNDNYSIRIFDGNRDIFTYSSTNNYNIDYATLYPIDIAGLQWNLQLSPTQEATSNLLLYYFISILSVLFLSLLVAFGAYYFFRRLEFNEESEARLEAVFDKATDGIINIDDKGFIMRYNKACEKIFGYTASEVVGKNISMLMPEPYAGKHALYLSRYKKEKNKNASELTTRKGFEGRKKDGLVFPIDLSISEVSIGEENFFSAIVRDVTERKQFIERITKSNTELERFAYVASHDLQEPLRMITNFTSLLEKKYINKLDQQAQEYIRIARNSALCMQDLVRDLLEYARLGHEAEYPQAVDLNDVLVVVEQNLHDSITNKKVKVIYNDLPVIQGNPIRFVRLMQNLIGNAIKYQDVSSQIEPKIVISSFFQEEVWLIAVEDNGIGMNVDYCDRVFEPFSRLHGKEEYSGTGMGLAISRKIVEELGGRIWVESKEGEGSTFYFTVPIHNNDIESESRSLSA